MVCECWKTQLDIYLDGELPSEETHGFDSHIRRCPSCAADALARVQMKRAVQAASKRFTPTVEFRRRVQQNVVTKRRRSLLGFVGVIATAMVAIVVAVGFATTHVGQQRVRQEQVYSELADMHVATLASSSQVDVVSTDRHTVKPWFQGKIPFTFDLPELQNSEFSLLGGRITYLGQTPGAHLIYKVRKHEISVFIFQERAVGGRWEEGYSGNKELSFNIKTWSQGGLRYCMVGDAAFTDIADLAELLKRAATS
jgi:anti-sigma factor RsiW